MVETADLPSISMQRYAGQISRERALSPTPEMKIPPFEDMKLPDDFISADLLLTIPLACKSGYSF